MRKNKKYSFFALLFMLWASTAFAEVVLTDTIKGSLSVRPRLEMVDGSKWATALTNRMQLAVQAEDAFNIPGLELVLEATKVSAIVEDYNSTSTMGGNANTDQATVIDPPITALTKAYLRYTKNNTSLIVGERPINLNNQRFIGSVGWRQMPQTFGEISITQKLKNKASLYGALLYRRNGIKPELNKRYKRGNLLFNSHMSITEALDLTGYAFLLEGTHNTFGLRSSATLPVRDLDLSAVAEYAIQRDPLVKSNFSGKVETQYLNGELGARYKQFFSKIGMEVLGEQGAGSKGFSTPLATLHAFNGWSDTLLGLASGGTTSGLKDLHITLGYKSEAVGKAMLVYHKYDSVINGVDYGSEIDVLLKKQVCKNASLLLKAAFYQADASQFNDVSKYWVMSQMTF